ncbi:hypothetical protein V3851_21505 [Paenibacillus sp. M1]|uniref:Phage tail assembly protein n=1 Tax=Paenibacillus haidiansis TaxID=1574488 RepID=A0ABU7VYV0_9BACL
MHNAPKNLDRLFIPSLMVTLPIQVRFRLHTIKKDDLKQVVRLLKKGRYRARINQLNQMSYLLDSISDIEETELSELSADDLAVIAAAFTAMGTFFEFLSLLKVQQTNTAGKVEGRKKLTKA